MCRLGGGVSRSAGLWKSREAVRIQRAIVQACSVMKHTCNATQNRLTANKAGERLSEKRQELIHFRQSLGVPGIALQHRPTSWHVESGRIHRVHLSSVVLDRSSSGRKKRKGFSPASSPRIINTDEPGLAIFRRPWNAMQWMLYAKENSPDIGAQARTICLCTSHSLKPLHHLIVCSSSTARNSAESSS